MEDNFSLEELLKSWGLPELISPFTENLIDEESFWVLDNNALKELIPQVGLRLRFLQKYNLSKAPIDIEQHSATGYELLENDFAKLHPGGELKLFALYDSVSSAFYEVYHNTTDKVWYEKLEDFHTEEIFDVKVLKFFMLLPYIIPSVTACKSKESQYRPSKLEVLQSFNLHIVDISKLKEELEARKQRLTRFKLNLQPQVVVVGPTLEIIDQCYVTVIFTTNSHESSGCLF